MARRIDLHIHTNISNGALSPKEVIDEAVKNSVDTIAIADHDSIEAYNDELYNYARDKNVRIINAVEISTKIDKGTIHVLGYNFDINNENFKQKLFALRNARHDYLYKVAEKMKQLGYIINVDELNKIEAVTKAHIAQDIVRNEKNESLLLKEFGKIPSKGEFIEAVMNYGCPAFVRKETLTPKEAADLIKSAGGKAILAHPIAYVYERNMSEEEIINIANEMEADGIEANYIHTDYDNNRINDSDIWNRRAKENHFITTVGTDFHYRDGVRLEIGMICDYLNLNANVLNEIIDNLLK